MGGRFPARYLGHTPRIEHRRGALQIGPLREQVRKSDCVEVGIVNVRARGCLAIDIGRRIRFRRGRSLATRLRTNRILIHPSRRTWKAGMGARASSRISHSMILRILNSVVQTARS